MVNRNLLRQFDSPDDDIAGLETIFQDEIHKWIETEEQEYEANKIVTGKVLEIRGDDVVIDIGYKSEGVIQLDEWKEDGGETPPPKPGDTVEVLLETVESEDGTIARCRTARRSGRRSGTRFSPSTRKATSSPARCSRRSRAGCWSTSA